MQKKINIFNYTSYFKLQKGFTLIEMMIAVVIFSIVIGTATGVFVSAIRLQKYNLTYQQILDQTSYAMEYMSRAIRMAKRNESSVCSSFSNSKNYNWEAENYIEFATYHNPSECWKFFLETSTNRLKVEKGASEYYLTSDDFDVTNFRVMVVGDDGGTDGLQSRVTIFMEMRGQGRAPQPKIQVQTTISQRDLDILP